MASWASLATSTLYTTLLTQVNDRDVDSAKAFDPANTTVTSPLTGHVRYNSANKRWETYNGTVWNELIVAATDAFAMTVTGVRGGNLYGTVVNNGTISGGIGNFTTLQVGSSDVWTVASLTNLNQLTNGPGFLTSSSLSTYALLAGPTFTGVPAAPTAAAGTNTTQIATTAFVIGQGYATSASLAGTYAPIGGSGTSGTWPISITGNAATVTQRTFSNVRTDGINRGSYGSISVASSTAGWAGIDFTAMSATFMVEANSSGLYRNNTTWDWEFTNGALVVGTVPWTSITGRPSAVSAFSNDAGYQTSTGTVTNVFGSGTVFAASGTFSGLVKGNSGGVGLGRITTTTTTGSPAGTSVGDLVLVY